MASEKGNINNIGLQKPLQLSPLLRQTLQRFLFYCVLAFSICDIRISYQSFRTRNIFSVVTLRVVVRYNNFTIHIKLKGKREMTVSVIMPKFINCTLEYFLFNYLFLFCSKEEYRSQ